MQPMKVKLTRTEEETLKWTDKPEINRPKLLVKSWQLCLQESEILWDKPTIIGACKLYLAKKFMFEFHSKVTKKDFDCNYGLFFSCMKCAQETSLQNYSRKNQLNFDF